MKTQLRPIYHEYIISEEWRSKHPGFLAEARYQCAAMPWVKVGRGSFYRCHHLHYNTLGRERYWFDVVCLSPFVHDLIVHGILSGGKKPSQQEIYPNTAQQYFHAWCRLPVWAKYGAIALAFGLAGYLSSGVFGMVAGVLVVIFVLR